MLAVGDSTRLEVIFDTKSYNGIVTKRPRILLNDGLPEQRVSITSNVTPFPDSTYPVRITPHIIDITQFGDIVRDSTDFYIMNVSDNSITITSIDIPSVILPPDLDVTINACDSSRFIVKLTDEGVNSQFAKSITFECDDVYKTIFTIPIKRLLRN